MPTPIKATNGTITIGGVQQSPPTPFAIYTRHGELRADECASVDDARETLEGGSDAGEIFAIGIYDPLLDTIYMLTDDDFPLPRAERVARIRARFPAARDAAVIVLPVDE